MFTLIFSLGTGQLCCFFSSLKKKAIFMYFLAKSLSFFVLY